jgi:ribosomal protein L16/L10AE
MFEMDGVAEPQVKEAFEFANYKLPLKALMVKRNG